jgi:hypothetical protein
MVLNLCQQDMMVGREIMTTGRDFYNGRSVLEETDYNQKRFNSFVEQKSESPEES